MSKIVISPDVFARNGNPWGPVADQPGAVARPRPSRARDFGNISEAPVTRPVNLKMVARAVWDRLEHPYVEAQPLPHKPLALRHIAHLAEIDPWDAGELERRAQAMAADHAREVERNLAMKTVKGRGGKR